MSLTDIIFQINNRGAKELITGASTSSQPLDASRITRIVDGTGNGQANDLATLELIVQGDTNEQQAVQIIADGGTYTLDFNGSGASGPIAYDADVATVTTALEALATIGVGDVLVTGGPGDSTGSAPYTIEYQGALAAANQPLIVTDDTNLTLSTTGSPAANPSTVRQGGAATNLDIDLQNIDDGFGDPSNFTRLNGIIVISTAIVAGEVLHVQESAPANPWGGWGGERIIFPGPDANNVGFTEWVNPSDDVGAIVDGANKTLRFSSDKNRITAEVYLIGVSA